MWSRLLEKFGRNHASWVEMPAVKWVQRRNSIYWKSIGSRIRIFHWDRTGSANLGRGKRDFIRNALLFLDSWKSNIRSAKQNRCWRVPENRRKRLNLITFDNYFEINELNHLNHWLWWDLELLVLWGWFEKYVSRGGGLTIFFGSDNRRSRCDWYVDIVCRNIDYWEVGTIWVFMNTSSFSGFFYLISNVHMEGKDHGLEVSS